ncbi:MAG: response regulator transcription factor [Ignavibacteriaceae bacterium]
MRILIIEDNTRMRKIICRFISEPGDVIMECSDGDEALAAYTIFRPDWVLMDYEMARVDGVTATKEIMENDPSAKVLIVSQYNDIEIQEAAVNAGAIKFISKENLIELKRIISNS